MDLWVVNYDCTRAVGPGSGICRAIHRSEAPGFGLSPECRAKGQSAQGVERDGRGVRGRDQAIWSRSNDRAGDRGGARADKPRWARILAITGGSSMAAMIVKVPPLLADNCAMLISNTRLSNWAKLRRTGAEGWGASA